MLSAPHKTFLSPRTKTPPTHLEHGAPKGTVLLGGALPSSTNTGHRRPFGFPNGTATFIDKLATRSVSEVGRRATFPQRPYPGKLRKGLTWWRKQQETTNNAAPRRQLPCTRSPIPGNGRLIGQTAHGKVMPSRGRQHRPQKNPKNA